MITLYGVTEDGTTVPVQVTEDGKLVVHKDESFKPGEDIQVGDVTATGDINAAGNVRAGGDARSDAEEGVVITNTGGVYACRNNPDNPVFRGYRQGTSTPTCQIFGSGSITAASVVESNAPFSSSFGLKVKGKTSSLFSVYRTASDALETQCYSNGGVANITLFHETGNIAAAGTFTAAGNKCGFTSAGELIFTSRGDRFKIMVQQGVCYAEPYTRQMELKEKAEQLREPKTQDIVPPTE